MKRTILIIAAALALAGCETEADKRAQFVAFCSTHDFSVNQCQVLYALRRDIAGDVSSAESNGLATGLAIGVSSGGGK